MTRHPGILAALVLGACSAASPPARQPPKPKTCAESVADLRGWLEILRGEGRSEPLFYGDHFALADVAAPPSQHVDAELVTIAVAGEIRISGAVVGRADHLDDAFEPSVQATVDRFRHKWSQPLTTGMLVVDRTVPWPVVVRTSAALAAAGVVRQQFVTHATQSALPPAPPSSLDPQFDAENRALAAATGAIVAGDVDFDELAFGGCPQALAYARRASPFDDAPERERALVTELPDQIAACGCAVEIPVVQRLFAYWWHRDAMGAPHAILTVAISPQGTPVRAGATARWASAASELLRAARANAPVRLVVE